MSFDFKKLLETKSAEIEEEVQMDIVFDQAAKAERHIQVNVGVLQMMHGWRDTAVMIALLRTAIAIAIGAATKMGVDHKYAFKLIHILVDSYEKSLEK